MLATEHHGNYGLALGVVIACAAAAIILLLLFGPEARGVTMRSSS